MVSREEFVGSALARLVAHAEEVIAYEEASAEKDGLTPDKTWDEWQRGKDILTLRDELLRLRGGGAVTGRVDELVAQLRQLLVNPDDCGEDDCVECWPARNDVAMLDELAAIARDAEQRADRAEADRDTYREWVRRIWVSSEQEAYDALHGPDAWARDLQKEYRARADSAEATVARLQDELADAREALREARDYIADDDPGDADTGGFHASLVNRLDAALSAGATDVGTAD